MPRKARVAIVQSSDAHDPAENLAHVRDAVHRLRDRDLILFPELALQGHAVAEEGPDGQRRALAATPDEDVEDLHDLIARSRASVVFGALVQRAGQLHNLAIYSDGSTRASYAKTHVHWSETFAPGDAFRVVDSPVGPLGMLICFDAAFPEVGRALTLQGARAIANLSAIPAAFPLEIVHRRLVACSVHNQVWTFFANRRGEGFRGGSAVVDPLGEVVAVAGERDEVLEAEIDLDLVDAWRANEPLLAHRRPALYRVISNMEGPPDTPK